MSLFGTSPDEAPSTPKRSPRNNRASGLFDDDQPPSHKKSSSSGGGLFADDTSETHGHDESSPWDMPTPRKQQSRAELIRRLLPAADSPESYVDVYESIIREDGTGSGGRIPAAGIAKLFAMARLDADAQASIMAVVAPGNASDVTLGQNEFNVVLALVGLAQEGDIISLDSVDERKNNLPRPKLQGLTAEPAIPPVSELAAKPPQEPEDLPDISAPSPSKQQAAAASPSPSHQRSESNTKPSNNILRSTMEDPEDDPWGSPELHKGHAHTKQNGTSSNTSSAATQNGFGHSYTHSEPSQPPQPSQQYSSTSGLSTSPTAARRGSGGGGWGDYGDSSNTGGGFGNSSNNDPFGGDGAAGRTPGNNQPSVNPIRSVSGRTGSGIEESVTVALMPGKEGIFMFQHHNYEVSSPRRQSKVIRRYSDFVWLLDCLQKRYPFRVLPLLPPKRVAVNGNHLSNDGSFIEKRRRGLSRFLNALVRHPILSQEQLVIMFLTVPTELAVWRKQSTISVQDEFTDRHMPPGLEDSLPATLEDLFSRTRNGVRRSAELYINVCNIMDRLVKRTEGVAADHARIAMSLASLTETSNDTYATDTNEIPLLNDGLTAMSKHLSTCQSLLEDESRGWDAGVLEDLKRQRDALVSVREMFDRRERLDKDTIPYLERKIQTSETKLAGLRAKPEGTVKAGEIEKVAESIIKDKESIVQQHNRSVFVKECIRDELITFQSTQYHISRWNQDWAGERVKYAEMLADNWRRLIDELEGMPLGE